MLDAKKKIGKDGYITKDMARFYHALGAFNTNMVASIIRDPGLVKDATDYLNMPCVVHAAQCVSGGTWDELAHVCYKSPEGGPGIDDGPNG